MSNEAKPVVAAGAARHATSRREAGIGHSATARVVGPVPPRGATPELSPQAATLPAIQSLDTLMPAGPAGLVLPFAFAALRPDIRGWLGAARLARMADSLKISEKALLQLLGSAPQPPSSLGEPSLWAGQRVPLQSGNGTGWAELFWRPDRHAGRGAGQHAERGAFAIRFSMPLTGAVELRGRLEGQRLDAVMESAEILSRPATAELLDAFEGVLHKLNLSGNLTLRHTLQDRRT